jgi:very-short-patch-repair endonuclease
MAKEKQSSIRLGERLKLCESEPEKLFLVAANKLGYIDIFTPQYYILGYRLDFAIPDRNIAVEIDGYSFHNTKEQINRDYKREQQLEKLGWRFFRFTGSQVFNNPEGCVNHVIKCIYNNSNQEKEVMKTQRMQSLYQIAKKIDWIKSEDGEFDDISLQINSLETSELNDKGLILMNSGSLNMKNEPVHPIVGFWDDVSQKITFMRVFDKNDPSKYQIFTGYRFVDGATNYPTLAGSFEGFQGTGATAQRTLYGWYSVRKR